VAIVSSPGISDLRANVADTYAPGEKLFRREIATAVASSPNQKYTFGVVKTAQARGDFYVLAERGRRALRARLGKDVKAGLAKLQAAVEQALA
jgi:hypothetical protein